MEVVSKKVPSARKISGSDARGMSVHQPHDSCGSIPARATLIYSLKIMFLEHPGLQ